MAIYGIEGEFGSGKSSLATFIANKNGGEGVHIWSNIPMNEYAIKNYHYFEDDKFVEILRTVNLINDIEREEAGYTVPTNSLTRWKRNMFSHHIILFDEVGAVQNNRNWKNQDTVQTEYINQNRKNMSDIYIITADGSQADKSLRRFCEWWYYCHPLFNFWFFKDIKVVRSVKKDSEGKIVMKQYIGRDEQGEDIVKQTPEDYYHTFFWQPSVWSLYDDLHKNIKDPDKYLVNLKHIQQIIKQDPYILEILKNNFPLFFEKHNLLLEPNIL